jgi:hypothetical protein
VVLHLIRLACDNSLRELSFCKALNAEGFRYVLIGGFVDILHDTVGLRTASISHRSLIGLPTRFAPIL